MTKNEDVGYKFYPDTPKSREQYKNLVLKSISTAELVAELATRDVEWLKLPHHEKIIFDMLFDKIKCKILVVRE